MPTITRINPPSFVSDATLNLKDRFGKLLDSFETKSIATASKKKNDQKEKLTSDESLDHSSLTTVSTDAVFKVNPGVIISTLNPDVACKCVSAVNHKEAWCGGGKDLVLVDIHGHVKRKTELNMDLRAVVVTAAGDLFVTGYGGTNIIKYSSDCKSTNIARTEPYTTRRLCNTSVPDTILVCLYNPFKDDGKVVRMTTAGHIKQTIQKDKQHQSLYNDPLYVVENINEDVVVVDGCSPCTIVVVNKSGEYRYTYPDSSQSSHCESIASCYGIACDNVGCILVSDWGSHRIHQIDMDGKFIQFILTQQHGIQSPLGLSIDNKGQLWLCNNDGKEVTIYKYRS